MSFMYVNEMWIERNRILIFFTFVWKKNVCFEIFNEFMISTSILQTIEYEIKYIY
jgi:hypothetical protein